MAAKNRLTSKTVALPLWERVRVRGSGPSIARTPLTRIASEMRSDLSHKGRGKEDADRWIQRKSILL